MGLFVCLYVCLCVCLWVCYHDNSKLRASILTKLSLKVKVVTISSWLNFGRPAPPGRGSAVGQNFWLRLTTASVQCFRLSERFFCFVVAASYPFFVCLKGSVTDFFRAWGWGNTTHFQNELKILPVPNKIFLASIARPATWPVTTEKQHWLWLRPTGWATCHFRQWVCREKNTIFSTRLRFLPVMGTSCKKSS